jgi:hypothetical protein
MGRGSNEHHFLLHHLIVTFCKLKIYTIGQRTECEHNYVDLKRPVNGVGLLRNRNTIATSRFWAQSLIQKENNLGLSQLNWPHNTYVLYNYYKSL